ncbi:hypothetical protein IWX75_003327 [Arthrobacter sp. CAN_A6]|uniref:hypothetical protein n=1 Tax=Arthrobacter sp. CAN_A6 TaxID=2787721 RepID=UPI0018CB7905
MSEHHSEHLVAALARAMRDIRPYAAGTETTALAAKLEESVVLYWGADHGIPWDEMLSMARGVKNDATSPRTSR